MALGMSVIAKVTSIAIKTVTAQMQQLLKLILEEAHLLIPVIMKTNATETSTVTMIAMERMLQISSLISVEVNSAILAQIVW